MSPLNNSVAAEISDYLPDELAPLLTLFGEQVTKQFLSLCLGWSDIILLSMGPVGIITIIISTIRVGGVKWLKALVGRARESASIVELELLSSTSNNVCELWNGRNIVRMIGDTKLKDMFIDDQGGVYTLSSAYEKFQREDERPLVCSTLTFDYDSERLLNKISNGQPNLTLNVKGFAERSWETYVAVCLGIVLQGVDLVYCAMTAYYWNEGHRYAYPCFITGTTLIISGLLACGHIIESVTTEHEFRLNPSKKRRANLKEVIRIQEKTNVGDENFDGYSLRTPINGDVVLRTSRPNDKVHKYFTTTAVTVTIVGFVTQFIGFRGLHWSCIYVHIGITLLMTGVRAFVCRKMTFGLECDKIRKFGTGWEHIMLRALQIQGEGLPRESVQCLSAHFRDVVNRRANVQGSKESNRGRDLDSSDLCEMGDSCPSPKTTESLGMSLISALLIDIEHSRIPPVYLHPNIAAPIYIFDTSIPIRFALNPAIETSPDYCLAMNGLGRFNHVQNLVKDETNNDTGPQHANKLRTAIEKTINLLRSTHDILWKDQKFPANCDRAQRNYIEWKFDVLTGALNPRGARFQVLLRVELNGDACSFNEESTEALDALLQWSTISLKNRLVPSSGSHGEDVSAQVLGYYIIGYEDMDLGQLEHWIGVPHNVQMGFSKEQIKITPIFGLFLSDMAQVEADVASRTQMVRATSDSTEASNRKKILQTNYKPHSRNTSVSKGATPLSFATVSDTDCVEGHISRELFTIFLLAIVSQIEEVGGETRLNSHEQNHDQTSDSVVWRRWRNSLFDAISEILQETKLANEKTAFRIIIPVFQKFGLLPSTEKSSRTYRK